MSTESRQVQELLYQALETEQGGIKVYESALGCAIHPQLREEWTDYLEETRQHEQVLRETMQVLGLDPEIETPGRQVVRHIGESLVAAMALARRNGGAARGSSARCDGVRRARRNSRPHELGAHRSLLEGNVRSRGRCAEGSL